MSAKIEIKNGSGYWVDITGYLAADDGYKVTRNDLDSASSGRTLDGVMHRGRVTSKEKIECKARPLTQAESETLLGLIYPEYVDVRYISPRLGQRTVKCYSNNVPATVLLTGPSGEMRWKDISFPLTEV